MGRHQDYFTTPVVSQTSLFRHLQICILAPLSARVLTLGLAFPGLSDASAGLRSTFLGLGGAGRRVSQRGIPASQSVPFCLQIPQHKPLNTCGQICPDSQKIQYLGVRKEEGWSFLHPWPSLLFPASQQGLARFFQWIQRRKLGELSEEITGKDLTLGLNGWLG